MSGPQSGYTLPVFACAGAIAALRHLIDSTHPIEQVTLNLIEPPKTADIPIEQLSLLSKTSALAITRSDPGDNLDLTRNTPIWSVVSWANPEQTQQIELQGGEGIGQHRQGAAIYSYARQLMQENLSAELSPHQKITVKIILPEGRRLALRTSNAAFGVVDGLSLLGTSGIAQPLSAPGQLAEYRQTLRRKAAKYKDLVFCLGENGLDLALQHGIEADRRLKTANWIGPMLAEAGELKVRSILLFGYHGKLIKLAGGHNLLPPIGHMVVRMKNAAYCAQAGLETSIVQQVLTSDTTEAALNLLRKQDQAAQTDWVDRVYGLLAERIDVRSQTYIQNHTEQSILVGSVFFDRQRKIITSSRAGQQLLLSKS